MTPTSDHTGRVWAFALLSLLVFAVGYQATRLHTLYYSLHPPFYDSMSFTQQLATVMHVGRTDGVWAALYSIKQTTVFLPFFFAALMSSVVEPSRILGIWYQTFWLWGLCTAFFFSLMISRRCSPWLALALTVPLLGLPCLYAFNGGLSDFRMDLLFALLYGITGIVYFWMSSTRRPFIWVVLGVLLGCTLLSRATAPVFLTLGLLPPVLLRIWQAGVAERKALLSKLVLTGGIAGAVAGWFYLTQFDYLYFYYVIWNPDANASLLLTQSATHFRFVAEAIGRAVLVFVLVWHGVRLFSGWSLSQGLRYSACAAWIGKGEWAVLWFALAPVGFLVLRGAGLNPFVSMPSAFALYMFLVTPRRDQDFSSVSLKKSIVLLFLALGVVLYAIPAGIASHRHANTGSMAAQRTVLDTILRDAKQHGIRQVRFAMIHRYWTDTASLVNVLIYDYPSRWDKQVPVVDGVAFHRIAFFNPPTKVQWERLPGANTVERIQNLTRYATTQLDYLILPTVMTLGYLEQHVQHIFANRMASAVKASILKTGNWIPVSETIHQSDDEQVVVYRNNRRAMISTP